MAEYQKEFAIGNLDLAETLLQKLLTTEPPGQQNDTLKQIVDLIRKAKEHIGSV